MSTPSLRINKTKLRLIQADITSLDVDAVVNAANHGLAPGGGVCGAIHRAAGPQLWEECKGVAPCETGQARITKGYNLLARHVIHTVGPVYHGSPDDPILLSNCYLESLKLADQYGLRSIAFPSISTGIFGYPVPEAARVAITAIRDYALGETRVMTVIMSLFSDEDLQVYRDSLTRLALE